MHGWFPQKPSSPGAIPHSPLSLWQHLHILALLPGQGCSLSCPGGREMSHLSGSSHWCLLWLIWQGILLCLASFPISPGADFAPCLACQVSDALGGAQGCPWNWREFTIYGESLHETTETLFFATCLVDCLFNWKETKSSLSPSPPPNDYFNYNYKYLIAVF